MENTQNHILNLKNYNGVHLTNSLERFNDMIISNIGIDTNSSLDLEHIYKDINRCFRFDTIEEIIAALKEENTIFSKFCLEKLENKSPLALAVTLKMLRNARKMEYSEIIKQELNVAKNTILRNPDFDAYMQNKLNKKKTHFKNSKISNDEVESYFEECSQNINLDLKPFSLLPNKDFINKYPDCFKFTVNENKRANAVIRERFDYELFFYLLKNYNIDMRDTRVNIAEIREAVGKFEKKEKIIAKNQETLMNFLNDQKLVEQYIQDKQKHIQNISNEEVNKIVEKSIRQKFEKVKFFFKFRILETLVKKFPKAVKRFKI